MSAVLQLGLLDAWERECEEVGAAAEHQRRIEEHRRTLRACWPDWDGPRVGGLCSVGIPVVRREDGESIYAYAETCRLLGRRSDGTWLAVIEMGEVDGRPWPKDGTRLILNATEVWAPVRELIAARRAAHPTERSESDGE